MEIKKNHSLKALNTFGINVQAKYFIDLTSSQDLINLPKETLSDNPFLILGSGSNILFTKNFDGLVIKNSILGIEVIDENESSVTLKVSSGVIWDDLVKHCVHHKYYGIENLSFIPGTVGAAPIQNIGAYGVEVSSTIIAVRGMNIITGKEFFLSNKDCLFSYRNSVFKSNYGYGKFITEVVFLLSKREKFTFNYESIKSALQEKKIIQPSINDVRMIVGEIRANKLPDPTVHGNAGSFFKNPIINEEQYLKLKEKNNDLIYIKIDSDSYKIPAGWLIEKAGFKGKRFNNVGVHDKQALVLVNFNNGSGEELLELSNNIKNEILSKFNIKLETEVNII